MANRYIRTDVIWGLKKVSQAKVLGYQFNRLANCSNHIDKVKSKIAKVSKMIFLAGKNDIYKWRRLYIFMQYIISILYYGSH